MRRPATLLLLIAIMLGAIAPSTTLATDPVPQGSVVTEAGRVLPPPPSDGDTSSVHADMLASHAGAAVDFAPGGSPSILLDASGDPRMATNVEEPIGLLAGPAAGLPNGLRKEVLGFLPYWMLTDTALASMNYGLVSTIAYFSVGATKTGNLAKGTTSNPSTGWAGWTSSRMTQVINQAHANGVRVVLTVTMMAWDSTSSANQATLLGNSTYRSRLVSEIVSAVRARGADGVNLDFEPVASSLRAQYTSFVKQLKKGLVDGGVGDYLTVCVMASAATWASGYDVAGLTASGAADALFVMGYDYNWSGSSRAGGVAPIQSPYTIDVLGTMSDFLTETSGSKLIWGVPYYGRTWPTSSSALNATTLGGGSKAYTYTGHLAQAQQHGRRWDDVGKVPWYRHWDSAAGNWVQGYYDDVESLGIKYDLINSRGLAGTGMWTLLMDQGRDELWRLLANKFVNDTAPPVGGVSLLPTSVDSTSVEVSWRATDFASGVAEYDVQVRAAGGAWAPWLSNTTSTSAVFIGSGNVTYQFRVRATDNKGNTQAWASPPGKPAVVKPGYFARVSTSALNIRSGPGTGYGVIASAGDGDWAYVVEGPVASGGYQWFRVQYGFSEWSSADYPLIGWMASGTAGDPFLEPAAAPNRVKLDGFISVVSRTKHFSPNGDGTQDTAKTRYALTGDASNVQVEIVNEAKAVVRQMDLGPVTAGSNVVTWDGRTADTSWAPAGRYMFRFTVTDGGGGTHVGPASTLGAAAFDTWGIVADLTRPRGSGEPGPGDAMVAARTKIVINWNEPIRGVGHNSVQLRTSSGERIPARVYNRADHRRTTVTPEEPMPIDGDVTVWFAPNVRDRAGNRLATGPWTFSTAPGEAFDPSRATILAKGKHIAYRIGANGDLLSAKLRYRSSEITIKTAQRAELPNLPGAWLWVPSGTWRDRWARESADLHLRGESARSPYPSSTRIQVRAGSHTGYKFDDQGRVTGSKSYGLASNSGANIDARAVINGTPHFRVLNGVWAGFWLPESSLVYRAGIIARQDFPGLPRVDLEAGRYTGYRFTAGGSVRSTKSATLASGSGANVASFAIINGRPHYLVANGIWAGYWVREISAIDLKV